MILKVCRKVLNKYFTNYPFGKNFNNFRKIKLFLKGKDYFQKGHFEN